MCEHLQCAKLPRFVLTATAGSGQCYPHGAREEIEAGRGEVVCPRSHSRKLQSQEADPHLLTANPQAFPSLWPPPVCQAYPFPERSVLGSRSGSQWIELHTIPVPLQTVLITVQVKSPRPRAGLLPSKFLSRAEHLNFASVVLFLLGSSFLPQFSTWSQGVKGVRSRES